MNSEGDSEMRDERRQFEGPISRLSRGNGLAVTLDCSLFEQSRAPRASEGRNSGLLEIDQTLQVVGGRHQGHAELRASHADGPNQFAPHLLDAGKDVFHPRADFGQGVIALFLPLRQGMVARTLALDAIPVARFPQRLLPLRAGVTLVGVDRPAGVGRVEHGVEVLAVMRSCVAHLELADQLVALIRVDAELVAVVALAVLLGPGGVQVLLPPFGRGPLRRHSVLFQDGLIVLAEVLLRGGHQGGVDQLAATGDVTMPDELFLNRFEQGGRTFQTDAVLEHPHRVAVGNAGGMREPTEALVAHPVQELVFDLFVGEVVQPLEDQDAHHGLGRVRRSAAPVLAGRTRRHPVHFRRQGGKVHVPFQKHQRVAQGIKLLSALVSRKQVGLDRAALHPGFRPPLGSPRILSGCRSGGVFRGAHTF